jgi:hypothetical protein
VGCAGPLVAALATSAALRGRVKNVLLEPQWPHAILRQMVTYRVINGQAGSFVVEAFRDDRGTWRFIDEFPTLEEANARKVRLEQIFRASWGELGGAA